MKINTGKERNKKGGEREEERERESQEPAPKRALPVDSTQLRQMTPSRAAPLHVAAYVVQCCPDVRSFVFTARRLPFLKSLCLFSYIFFFRSCSVFVHAVVKKQRGVYQVK